MLNEQMYIGGKWVDASDGATMTISNPSTNEAFLTVPRGTVADANAAVAAARAAFEGPKWSRLSPARRGRLLLKVAELLERDRDEFARLEVQNSGKTISEAHTDVQMAIESFAFYGGAAPTISGRTVPTMGSFFTYTVREPVGVCAQIIPWNYPIMMAAWKIAPALACGNTVVLKPASLTPHTALRLAKLIEEAGIPGGALNVITGPGASIGSVLTQHPDVDKVAFTGSTETGRGIMAAAAGTIKKVSLELGGKSPALVFADADLDMAINGALASVFRNAGQMCTARTRILVERSIYASFLDRFANAARALRVGDPMAKETQMGALISPDQLETVASYVAIGRDEGAELVCGGEQVSTGLGGNFYAPTVFADERRDLRIVQEEIFGPVAVVQPFDDEAQAIASANDSIYGLAATIWTTNIDRAHRVARGVRAGNVWVNTWVDGLTETPFGGYKQSGLGRELGLEAIELYTQVKSVGVSLDARMGSYYRD
ncbi:MAG TPA: aldehyde dehydrogenase family protein [Herpetosiphonaceae bacterium]